MIIHEPFEDGRLTMYRKCPELDNKNDAWQTVRVEVYVRAFEKFDTRRDSVIGNLSVVKCDAAILIEDVQTEFEIGKHRLVGVLAVDKAKIDLLVDLRRRDRTGISV